MPDTILTLNAGSSTLKFALFEVVAAGDLTFVAEGTVEGRGTTAAAAASSESGAAAAHLSRSGDVAVAQEDVIGEVMAWAEMQRAGGTLVAVGHRVVHGGTEFAAPVEANSFER